MVTLPGQDRAAGISVLRSDLSDQVNGGRVVGSSVGPYQVLSRLGAGGMGEVFLGQDPRLQRRVALKCLSTDIQDAEQHARILREARAVARISHSNIAAVFDVLEQDGRAFIVMEYVEGHSLAERLASGPLPPDEVRTIGRQLASALTAAHSQGVVHRDLKPANIHLTDGGGIKVLDFGVAKLSPARLDPEEATSSDAVEATLPGSPGTPLYMSPEQLLGADVDGRSDIYSAGVILFQAVTGARPFPDTNVVSLALAMTSKSPRTARSVNPAVPAALDHAIARALERDPDKRFQTAAEFESALAASDTPDGLRGSVVVPMEASEPFWRRHAWFALAATALLIAVGLAARGVIQRALRPSGSIPTVIAVLPVDSPAADASAGNYGVDLASVVAQNIRSVSGVTVVSRAQAAAYGSTRDRIGAILQGLGAGYVLDLRLKSPPPQVELEARLHRSGSASAVWAETIAGDPLRVEQTLLDHLTGAMERLGVWRRMLTEADRTQLRRVPTTNAEAFAAFSEARALVGRPGGTNTARVIGLLDRAVTLDPKFVAAHAALADALLERYRVEKDPSVAEKANAAVTAALRLDAHSAAAYASLGNVQWATGRYQEAVGSLKRSIELQPDDDETHRLLGRVLAERGDVDAAVAELQEAILRRPGYGPHYMTLGAILYGAGRYTAALDAYRHASELQPNEPGPFAGLGLINQVLGNHPQAIGNYEHAVRLGPSASAYSNLGLAYYSAKRYREAIDAWKQALAIAPRYVLYHRNIGDAYQRLNEKEAAAAAYREAVRLGEDLLKVNSRDIDMITLVAVCEAKLGRTRAAERHAAEALALAPASRIALQRSAEVHALVGNLDAALKDLNAAIEKGYSRVVARENDEFSSLRKLPAFQSLVAEPPAAVAKER